MKALILIVLLFAMPLQAATFYVRTGGDDAHTCTQAQTNDDANAKQTITAALACAGAANTDEGAGDTVQVADGTYVEQLIDKIPGGTAAAPFVLKSANYLGAIIRPNTNGSIIGLNYANYYITIDGFTIDGVNQSTNGTGIGLSAYNYGDIHHVKIINNEIKNVKNDGLTGGYGTFMEIRNNLVHDVGSAAPGYAHGMYIPVANSVIEYNRIYNTSGYGLLCSGAAIGTIYDFRPYKQDGTALDTYTMTPRLTVASARLWR